MNAQWTTYDMSNSAISSNGTQRVVVDPSNGDILVGTIAGFNVKSSSGWALHTVASGALGHNTAVISMRDGGNLWVTTDGGGVSRYNGTSWTIFNPANSGISDTRIYNIGKAPSGIIWFGTRDGGLCSYNGSAWNTISVSNNLSVNYDRVMGMDIDASGVIWIGTAGGGLAKYNPTSNQWAQYSTSNSTILHNDVYTVSIAPDGKIWAGTFAGLSIFDPVSSTFVAHLSSSNSIMPDNYIRGIDFDNLGRGYVAMGYGGVARVETNYTLGMLWTSSNSNLPSDTCWHLSYGNGTVWVATLNEGIASLGIDVGVNETTVSTFDLNLFPNPTSDHNVTLKIVAAEMQTAVISMYSETGELVWTTSAELQADIESRIVIPVADKAAGMYFVEVVDGQGLKKTLKVIHQ
jgi:hypothetical protein